jgi:SAM-dependent methyltransferase
MMQAMSAPVTFKISDEVRDVLARSTVTATSVTLPPGQLDRKLYEAVNKALVGAGGKWDRKAGAHVFVRDPREVLGLAVETGKAVNVKTTLQAFYTPESLAERVVRAVGIAEDERVVQARAGRAFGRPLALEPSVGDGALAVALIKAAGGHVFLTSCDIDPVATAAAKPRIVAAYREAKQSAELAASVATQVHTHDFLKTSLKDSVAFDYVVMNPPFKGGADIKHVSHAYNLLAPGGTLVAIMWPAWQTATTKAAVAFRELVASAASSDVEDIEAGTFKDTPVRTVMLTLRKGS